MKYEILQELIGSYGDYESEMGYPPSDMGQFVRWLSLRTAPNEALQAQTASGDTVEVAIGRIVFFLTRYAKTYTKRALEGSPLGSLDEFVYLAALADRPETGMGKMELIRHNRHEKPTGMEIIRRLIALGLVVQNPSPTDKRSAVLYITPLAWQVLPQLFERMSVVSRTVVGNLLPHEQVQLAALLEKLEHFHQDLLGKLGSTWQLEDLPR